MCVCECANDGDDKRYHHGYRLLRGLFINMKLDPSRPHKTLTPFTNEGTTADEDKAYGRRLNSLTEK